MTPKIGRLSKDIGDKIAALMSPLSRAALGRALVTKGFQFNFMPTHERSARVWDMIFKDDSWLDTIANLKYDGSTSPPNPTLLGNDLIKLYYGSSSLVYIALLISDFGGECVYERSKFFTSLREHDYDE